MCGIAGIIGPGIRDGERYEPIEAMTGLIAHRGPDGSGHYCDEGIALGHRRLSIIDLSSLGQQPMVYLERYVITYNGEVYNYIELRKELEGLGYSFLSHTDTEVIMAAYDRWREGCLDRFNGMFSFAIYDRSERKVFCARDRFGVKPFYYSTVGGSFVFGSEIKQFTRLPGWKSSCNKPLAADFLSFGLQGHTPATMFEEVSQLQGGHFLIFDMRSSRYDVRSWYRLTDKIGRVGAGSFDDAREEFSALLSDAVRLRLRSDVTIGSCLSGGLDSSSIVCLVSEQLKALQAGDYQQTVTSCFEEKRFDERTYADAVVAATRSVNHKVFPSFERLFGELEDMIWHQDEPFLSTSIYAQWNVFRTARQHRITVMLDGQGADEILGGYPTFFAPHLLSLLKSARLGRFLSETRGIVENTPYGPSWVVKELSKNVLGRSGTDAVTGLFSGRRKILGDKAGRVRNRTRQTFSDFKEMSLAQVTMTNLPMLLQYEDRNSMAFSIESRVPFLDYRLVEFASNQPVNFLLHNGKSKYILRESMRGRVPDMVLDRKDKMGFVTAEELWLKHNPVAFESRLKEAIDRSDGFVSPNCLDTFRQMRDGRAPFNFTIWRVIAFGAWLKKFDVQL